MADFGQSSDAQHPAEFETMESRIVSNFLAWAPPNIPDEQAGNGDPVDTTVQAHQPALQFAPYQPAPLIQDFNPIFYQPDSNGASIVTPGSSGEALQPLLSPAFEQIWPEFGTEQAQLIPALPQGQWQQPDLTPLLGQTRWPHIDLQQPTFSPALLQGVWEPGAQQSQPDPVTPQGWPQGVQQQQLLPLEPLPQLEMLQPGVRQTQLSPALFQLPRQQFEVQQPQLDSASPLGLWLDAPHHLQPLSAADLAKQFGHEGDNTAAPEAGPPVRCGTATGAARSNQEAVDGEQLVEFEFVRPTEGDVIWETSTTVGTGDPFFAETQSAPNSIQDIVRHSPQEGLRLDLSVKDFRSNPDKTITIPRNLTEGAIEVLESQKRGPVDDLSDLVETAKRPRITGHPVGSQLNAQAFGVDLAAAQALGGPICERCQDIDLHKIFARPPLLDGNSVACIKVLDHVTKISRCPWCIFFTEMSPDPDDEDLTGHALFAYSLAKNFFLGVRNLKDTILFSVMPKGNPTWACVRKGFTRIREPVVHAPNSVSLRDTSGEVNWRVVKEWIHFCRTHHDRRCESAALIPRDGLKVINVQTRKLVHLPTFAPYVAISYVRGTDRNAVIDASVESGDLPHTLPPLLEDSIQTVNKLGYRYLWVDHCCLPQRDVNAKGRLIQRMGDIYASADLTLIAAVGDGPHHGLPRTNPGEYRSIPTKLGFFAAMPITFGGVVEDVQKSAWNSQGWTYQEGLRSRRRLVFTENQVYFQCRVMQTLESVSFPLEALHTDVFRRMRKSGLPQVFPYGEVSLSSAELVQHIATFCSRSFLSDDDALNSFQGILRQFSKRTPPTPNLWGVPMLPNIVRPPELRLLHGLLWEGKRRKRRRRFPSWTWAGWTFEKQSGFCLHSDRPSREQWIATNASLGCCQFTVEITGRAVHWEDDYAEELAVGIHKFPFLKIRAQTVDLSLDEFGNFVKLKDPTDGLEKFSWRLDECIAPDDATQSIFKGLIVGRVYYEDDQVVPLGDADDQTAESANVFRALQSC